MAEVQAACTDDVVCKVCRIFKWTEQSPHKSFCPKLSYTIHVAINNTLEVQVMRG
jgi:hypothetical protein